MFNSSDRPGHLARWIADATHDTEGHEIEKCDTRGCSYCADRVAVEQFEEMAEALEIAARILSFVKDGPIADPLKYIPHSAITEGYEKVKAALRKARGEA